MSKMYDLSVFFSATITMKLAFACFSFSYCSYKTSNKSPISIFVSYTVGNCSVLNSIFIPFLDSLILCTNLFSSYYPSSPIPIRTLTFRTDSRPSVLSRNPNVQTSFTFVTFQCNLCHTHSSYSLVYNCYLAITDKAI